ncbi:hypothetical protein EIN_390460 [Entamoeba invadens IP1]|uniref:Uncharacterized protein n=1 Tax=Entamoeba invadens IP1 TaxID=370355 RepID=A0A0A1UB55_ENTIV|nr:hypothetical protein EIN_390460 [Entamoeba invadens IP1]ELP89431.1 hypothetical protein EIN_390460 [Entamoeba invadens IP1]|eukprot:XP_004256202.1 hypothetical protein EIN_390460 [Entamoeba invadens IP1]
MPITTDGLEEVNSSALLITVILLLLGSLLFGVITKLVYNYLTTQEKLEEVMLVESRPLLRKSSSLSLTRSSLQRRSSSKLHISSNQFDTVLQPKDLPIVNPSYYVQKDDDGIDEYYENGNDYNSQFLSVYYNNVNTLNTVSGYQPITFNVDPYSPAKVSRMSSSSSSLINFSPPKSIVRKGGNMNN